MASRLRLCVLDVREKNITLKGRVPVESPKEREGNRGDNVCEENEPTRDGESESILV